MGLELLPAEFMTFPSEGIVPCVALWRIAFVVLAAETVELVSGAAALVFVRGIAAGLETTYHAATARTTAPTKTQVAIFFPIKYIIQNLEVFNLPFASQTINKAKLMQENQSFS